MSDAIIIALLSASCFIAWLLLRRLPAPAVATETTASTEPEAETPAAPDHTLITATTFSPAWHNENGWPAMALEYFPSLGDFEPDEIRLTEQVSATYAGPDLSNLTLEETIKDPPEVVLKCIREVTHLGRGPHCKTLLEIGPGVLERAKKDLPPGYDPMPTCVTVKIKMDLYGTAMR